MNTAVIKKDVTPSPKKTAAKAPEAGSEEPKTGHQADDAGREPLADVGVDNPQAPTENEAPAGVDVHHGRGGMYVVAGGVRQLLHRTALPDLND